MVWYSYDRREERNAEKRNLSQGELAGTTAGEGGTTWHAAMGTKWRQGRGEEDEAKVCLAASSVPARRSYLDLACPRARMVLIKSNIDR